MSCTSTGGWPLMVDPTSSEWLGSAYRSKSRCSVVVPQLTIVRGATPSVALCGSKYMQAVALSTVSWRL